ncbi:hypothetical protein [Sphingomonas sp. SUN039]|uniref:hypothetical protein n=1 Tax=Sphingomonas sp. SUN039 TaxID=2937787 RepID=UPI002164DCEE|nr:hypothetical protein [Sphingomonas sp. SUN039]UVO53996.1 hypothetical protein M0209_07630 [Sphingomonas sp. SUN039]
MENETVKPRWSASRTKLALAAVALVGVGAVGAYTVGATRPGIEMAPLTPVAIKSLADGSNVITVKGQVAEVYGSRFILADASGKTLVDTGKPRRDFGGLMSPAPLVTTGQPVTVQGRFGNGSLHASFLIGPDGKVVALRGMHGGHDRDGGGRHGERGWRGDGPRGEAPPPVAPATTPETPPVAAKQ